MTEYEMRRAAVVDRPQLLFHLDAHRPDRADVAVDGARLDTRHPFVEPPELAHDFPHFTGAAIDRRFCFTVGHNRHHGMPARLRVRLVTTGPAS